MGQRVGTFTGPITPFGVPTASVHPSDNVIVEDTAKAELERVKALQDELYEDIQNETRNSRPGKL